MNTAQSIITRQASPIICAEVAALIEDAADHFLTDGFDACTRSYTCAGAVTLAGKGKGMLQPVAHNVLQSFGSGRFDGRTPDVQAQRFMFMDFVALALKS